MWLRVRLALLVAALGVTLMVAWRALHPPVMRVAAPPRADAILDRPAPRPEPDERFLIAVADLHHLLTGAERQRAQARYADERWTISYGAEDVGTLSPYPEYSELRTLLTEWTHRLGPPRATAPPDRVADERIAGHLRDMRTLTALDEADHQWSAGRRDTTLLALAAHGYALLLLQNQDRVGSSDSLAARALAMVTLAAAVDPAAVTRDECLIAERLGYSAAACALADLLPEDDAVRWYVRRDGRLDAMRGRGVETQFLRLLRLADRADLEGWERLAGDALRRHPGLALPVLSSGLRLARFESQVSSAVDMLAAITAELRLLEEAESRQGSVNEHASLGDLIESFERQMDDMPSGADGPLLDRTVLRSYYRSCFYSGLRGIADHLLYSLSSAPGAQELAADMICSRPGAAEEFTRWFAHMAAAASGQLVGEQLGNDLGSLPHFGEPLLAQTLAQIRRLSFLGGSDLITIPGRTLAKRLDTRPAHLRTFSAVLIQAMWDPAGSEDVCAMVARQAHPADVQWWTWWSAYQGDTPRLLAIGNDPGLTPAQRVEALEALDSYDLGDPTAVAAAHQGLMAEHPADFRAVDRMATHLATHGDSVEGRRVLERWLVRRDRSRQAFDEIFARTHLARLLQEAGDPRTALGVIRPVVKSWQFGAMERAALILDDLGEHAAADSLAMAAWRRYPDSRFAQALVVRLLWERGNARLAARALANAGGIVDAEPLRKHLAPAIRLIAASRPALESAVAAAVETDDACVVSLRALSNELSRAGDDRWAFELASRLPVTGDDGRLGAIRSCGFLGRWRGPESGQERLQQLARGLEGEGFEKLVTLAFGEGEDGMLWVEWPPLPDDHAEYLWLLRAAAVIRAGDRAPAGQRPMVEEHFAKAGGSHYRALARYLLGLDTEAVAWSAIKTTRAAGEANYFFGLAAQARGDVRGAARWYARCAALNQSRNMEDYWARRQIAAWTSRAISLDRIAQELAAAPPAGAGPAAAQERAAESLAVGSIPTP